jgi:hypothetical protein
MEGEEKMHDALRARRCALSRPGADDLKETALFGCVCNV